jgi:dynein heavy chain 1
METVRTYSQTVAKLEANPDIALLVATSHKKAQDQIAKGAVIALSFPFVSR